MRTLCTLILLALLTVTGSCASAGSRAAAFADSKSTPALAGSSFPGTLPLEGEFIPQRTTAASSLSQSGSAFWDAAADVTAAAPDADFQPAGTSVSYAIWRFSGTPQDSLGSVSVSIDMADPGAAYWVGLSDYSADRWSWLGQQDAGGDASLLINGSAGQHSSPGGFIYVAVVAEGQASFGVESVAIEYLDRYDVSGFVLDMSDQPLAGALVTTNLLDSETVFSGADGSFSLHGVPAGTWALMATLDAYEFFPAAQPLNVSNSSLSGIVLRGNRKTSGFVSGDADEPNNYIRNSTLVNGSGPLTATISILDDPHDFYAFNVPAEGFYYLQLNADNSILFPSLTVLVDEGVTCSYSDYQIFSGSAFAGYYFQRSGRYYVDVSCEGGGGEYDFSLLPGELRSLNCSLYDDGSAGNGDDGLYEELYTARVEVDFGAFKTEATTFGTGSLFLNQLPMLPATVRPLDPLYTFVPAEAAVDLSTGDVQNLDFDLSASAPSDPVEPNNDVASATPLTLPLSSPVSGWIGGFGLSGNDSEDYFSFDIAEGQYLLARVRFPQNYSTDFTSSGNLHVLDAVGDYVGGLDTSASGLEFRSIDPLPAGNYELYLSMEGNLMPYELELFAFDGHFLSASYELEGQPVENCRMTYQTVSQGFTDSRESSSGLAESDVPFMAGERVYVHHERFGLLMTPAYEWVEFSDADIQLQPLVEYSGDSQEPNDVASPPAQPLPLSVQGTLSTFSDSQDSYIITAAAPGTLKLTLTPDLQFAKFQTTITNYPNSGTLLVRDSTGVSSFYFRAEAAGDYVVRVSTDSAEDVAYGLDVAADATAVYKISGALDNGVVGEANGYGCVVNHTTGDAQTTLGTSYLLGYYPDGNYAIEWQISNRTVTPAGNVAVQINGADEVVDFSAVYTDQDSHEPNDTSSAAALLTLPIAESATLDSSKPNQNPTYDSSDYYKFVAPSDGLLELTLKPQIDSPHFYGVTLAEDAWYNYVSYGKLSANASRRMLRWNVTAGKTYYIRASSNNDLQYDLNVDYVP